MEIVEHIFREYDIRGTVDVDLNEDFARLLGRAFAQLLAENKKENFCVGWDCRLSSPSYARALAEGLADGGIDVFLTGMGPTPQLYYSIYALESGGGIQVTGSHNPPDMNGFKMCVGTQTLSGAEIQDLKRRVLEINRNKPASVKRGAITERPIIESYTANLIANCRGHVGDRKLKIVVDAGNGVGGMVGPQVLRAMGLEVIELYCDPDGTFPNHHPDPTVMENIKDLVAKVKESNADFGIGWDGDADRIGVVNEKGEIIFGDMLLLIYGRALLKEVDRPTIIGDVKCSSLLFNDLNAKGANAIMWKTGHSLIKGKLRETNAELAGEMSGHIFFKHRYYGFDDAIYASARFAEIVSKNEGKVSDLLADLPHMVSTPEIRIDCPEEIKFSIIEKAQKAFQDYKVSTLDGVRIEFEKGWGLVRASNTQPVLVMRFEAEDQASLDQYQSLVTGKIKELRAKS